MSYFGQAKVSKAEAPDKTPYTIYYPHTRPTTERRWESGYTQYISIDPAGKNYALRIERWYDNGWIVPVVFAKVAVKAVETHGETTITNTYQNLTAFLNQYREFYTDCHYILIERQLPVNYQATRIAQHTISYFSLLLQDSPLLPAIVEMSPELKGKLLGAPKGITSKQLKAWSVEKGRELLLTRQDQYSLSVLDCFRNKQDDLTDTVLQIEAIRLLWGQSGTVPPPQITVKGRLKISIPAAKAPASAVAAVPKGAGQKALRSMVSTAPPRPGVVPKVGY